MSKLVAFESVTLDGVYQAPARPDEDPREGFPHGGWAVPYSDPELGRAVAESGTTSSGGMLLGRRTYEDFYQVWPNRTDNPYTEVLNNTQKYVASTTLHEPLPWQNSTLLKGDLAQAVAELKARQSGDILILGSGALVQSLAKLNLIDQYVLLIHPLVLGTGRRLFADNGTFATLRLVATRSTAKGVILAIYEAGEAPTAA